MSTVRIYRCISEVRKVSLLKPYSSENEVYNKDFVQSMTVQDRSRSILTIPPRSLFLLFFLLTLSFDGRCVLVPRLSRPQSWVSKWSTQYTENWLDLFRTSLWLYSPLTPTRQTSTFPRDDYNELLVFVSRIRSCPWQKSKDTFRTL